MVRLPQSSGPLAGSRGLETVSAGGFNRIGVVFLVIKNRNAF